MHAAPGAPEDADPRALYRKGKTAFDLGKWEDAVRYFEASYEKSGNELLLFNIGLSYYRWWEETGEIARLRKARSVLKTFVARVQRDPDRLGSPADAIAQLEEIEAKLKEAEEEERRKAVAPPGDPEPPPPDAEVRKAADEPSTPAPPPVPAEDPGKKLRLGGVVTMGLGGAAVLGGVVAGVIFALEGRKWNAELAAVDNDLKDRNAQNIGDTYVEEKFGGCDAVKSDPMPDENALTYCQLLDKRGVVSKNGQSANLYTALSFALVGGVGVALLAAGGGLYAVGARRTRAWNDRRAVTFAPAISPTFAGVGLSGRF